MLVLTREKGQVIEIGPVENPICKIKVMDIRGGKVRLGIEVDRGITVHREEVGAQIRQQLRKESQ